MDLKTLLFKIKLEKDYLFDIKQEIGMSKYIKHSFSNKYFNNNTTLQELKRHIQ